MKINRISLILALSCLVAGTVWAMDEGDSLISKGYIHGSYEEAAFYEMTLEMEAVYQEIYDEKMAKLEAIWDQYIHSGEEQVSPQFSPLTFVRDNKVILEQGTVVIPMQGSVTLEAKGTVIDLTTGTELEKGSLVTGHSYLVAEESTGEISVTTASAQLGIQGLYTVENQDYATEYPDVFTTDWYYQAVDFVTEKALFAGMEDGYFYPGSTMTRGMMMTVLYRLAGSPQQEMAEAQADFVDVGPEDWFETYVAWGFTQGLAVGTGDGYFMAESDMTRQEMLVMLHAFARDYLQKDVSHNGSLAGYSDGETIPSWASNQVTWAVDRDLLEGLPDGDSLYGGAYATRAEVATILMNFYLLYG